MASSSMLAPAVALVIACGALTGLTRECRMSAERFDGPVRPLPVMWCRPDAEPAGFAIAAHGTGSYKEIFLPLAWELASRGWALAAVDSRAPATEDGVATRARELMTARDELAGGLPRARLGFVGHSDGVAPALAAARLAPGARPPVVALGATFTRDERAGLEVFAGVGAFDQVSAAGDVRACPDPGHFTLSWMSDHFLEPSDPLLVPALASSLTGQRTPDGAIELCALRVLAFSLAVVSALLIGARASVAGTDALPRGLVVIALFAWIAGSAAVWPATVALAAIAGVTCGPATLERGGRALVITGLLMFVNVIATTALFRAELPHDLAWLPVALPWYVAAWIPRAALFVFSLLNATGPAGILVPPGLLLLAVAALLRPALGDRLVFRAATSGEPPPGERRLAAALLVAMLVLAVMRFAEGAAQPDALSAIAASLARSLVLPGAYLLALATGRLRV